MQDAALDIIKIKYFPKLPYLSEERSQKFFTVVLTLLALSFFGLFAINPTVSTILKLRKEISDSEFVKKELETKIGNLTELRKQYSALQGDLPTITNAITVQPDVPVLFAQIQSIARTSGIIIKKLQNFEVEILRQAKSADKDYSSYSFSIAGTGSLENISKFTQTLTDMERIINIDLFSIDNITDQNDQSLGFSIQGTAFFKDNPD